MIFWFWAIWNIAFFAWDVWFCIVYAAKGDLLMTLFYYGMAALMLAFLFVSARALARARRRNPDA